MQIQITGQHVEITPALKTHVEEKFEKLKKMASNITHVHVILKVEKTGAIQNIADANVSLPGTDIFASSSSDDMYHTIILLVEKLIKQINKHKEKLRA